MKLPHRGSCCVRDVGVRWEVLSNYWFIDVVPLGSFGYWSDCCYERQCYGYWFVFNCMGMRYGGGWVRWCLELWCIPWMER